MIKKKHITILLVISALICVLIAVALIRVFSSDAAIKDAAETDESSIFESISSLEALELGVIDGDELREQNGIEEDSDAGAGSELSKEVDVAISLRSIQNDLKIKFTDSSNDRLIIGVPFTATVTCADKTYTYTDSDMDGIIYISYVDAGEYKVFMSDVSEGGTNYSAVKSQVITVSDAVVYAKVDVKDEIKTEAEINVAEEDTKVQDVDETTDLSSSQGEGTNSEEQSYDEDISDEAEDLLAQIESENNASEEAKKKIEGPVSGTLTAPAIATDPQYVSAHSGVKGVDVSKHNGNIDWGAVKANGIDFAIIRCGYRGSSSGALVVDPLYYQNMIAAQGAGLSVGVYFFSQAVNVVEAVEEASMVLELLKGYTLQMPVYIDVEKSNGRGDAISVEERNAVINAFLVTIKNAGYTAGIYSNKLWFENRISTSLFLDYKIWLAQYVDIPTYYASRYDMWQYTSKGSVPGIAGNVDMNVIK
ncbi:MAG: glycoside hydrolase family 25 protein [Butyrivibrio sp.]|nr:glycoside hydrolase family 25 protein [Butyrivibrio sp.]